MAERSTARKATRRAAAARRARSGARGVIVAVALAVAASGCAMVSASGNVHETSISPAGSGQDYPQLIPAGPGKNWTPAEIVNGFILANASFADNFAIARSFLTGSEAATWQPNGAVTVVSYLQQSPASSFPKREANQPSDQVAGVQVTGAQLATLTDNGQYLTAQPSAGPAASSSSGSQPAPGASVPVCPQTTTAVRCYAFTLISVNNSWRISQASQVVRRPKKKAIVTPLTQLLLTQSELAQVYQQRNLYFFNLADEVLVPDAVFVPQNDTSAAQAEQLVRGLLKNPQGWLAGAAQTAFPPRTQHSQVQVNGTNAIVSLTVPHAAIAHLQETELVAQLVWTLTSTSYGPNSIQSVEVQINGRTVITNGSPYQLPRMYQHWLPPQLVINGPYFISRGSAVRQAAAPPAADAGSSAPLSSSLVQGPAGRTRTPGFSAIAVEPDQSEMAGLSQNGKSVSIGSVARGATMTSQYLGGSLVSLSWDRSDDLWAAGGRSLWLLAPDRGSTQEIDLSKLPSGESVTAFRVAPDGVRVAIIAVKGGKTQLQLAAITRTGPVATIGQPIIIGSEEVAPQSLTWYDADHVIVLTHPGARAQLEEIPLNGGTPTPVGTEPGTVSVSAYSGGLVAGLANGQIYVTSALDGQWLQVSAPGHSPVYPG